MQAILLSAFRTKRRLHTKHRIPVTPYTTWAIKSLTKMKLKFSYNYRYYLCSIELRVLANAAGEGRGQSDEANEQLCIPTI